MAAPEAYGSSPAHTTAIATLDLSCICDLSSWQCQIFKPLREAGD